MNTLSLLTPASLLLALLVMLLACTRDSPAETTDFTKTPIVFVHGSGLSSASWTPLRRQFERLGYPTAYLEAIDIPSTDTANDVAARRDIAGAATRVLQRAARAASQRGATPPDRVDLVAHSMGAFSSRYFAATLRPDQVRSLIAIAGANFGTNALCSSSLAGDRQMCPAFASTKAASALQVRLNGAIDEPRDVTPFGLGVDAASPSIRPNVERCIAYYTVRIDPDEWIRPARSAMLEGAGGLSVLLEGLPVTEGSPGNFLLTAPATHDELPANPRVIELVRRILSAADRQWRNRCRVGL